MNFSVRTLGSTVKFKDNAFILGLTISFSLVVCLSILIVIKVKQKYLIEDIEGIYTVHIINDQGDCTVKRTATFIVKDKPISKREHHAYSDGSTIKSDAFKLKAWDNNANPLVCKLLYDKPTIKRFEIFFPRPIQSLEKYTYTYYYSWYKMFEKGNDYYFLQDNAFNEIFNFVIPSDWVLQDIEAHEILTDGTRKTLKLVPKGKDFEEGFIKYKYAVQKGRRDSKVRVEWTII